MDGYHPKRRRDKYNPYHISQAQGRYYLSFRDGQGVEHDMEIGKELFSAFDLFELDDLSFLNQVDRHQEQSEQTEISLNRRAFLPQEPVEETVARPHGGGGLAPGYLPAS